MIEGLQRVLIVGGGIGGMAAAICFRRQNIAVDLIDLDPEWRVYGAGITIIGPTLRAYRQIGLLDKIREVGAVSNGTRLYHFSGAHIADMDEPALEQGLPATGGILRPVLHRIMSTEVKQLGTSVRLGLTVDALSQDDSGVDVTFSDGTSGRYGLVLGADGINSKVRSLVFPDAVKPYYTGQGSWRILAKRPEGLNKIEYYVGHRNVVGITPISAELVYVFMLNTDPQRTWIEPEDQPAKVRELLADFGGNIAPIRATVGPESSVVYRPLDTALQPKPWYDGRIVLVGDAAHATTPHLACGAGIAVEDALVLTDELARNAPDIEAGLAAFVARRFERCRYVLETSVAIGNAQIAGAPSQEISSMIGKALHHLAAEI